MKSLKNLDVQELLNEEYLKIHFQPIVSISKRKMIGVEALTRASFQGRPISPDFLFQNAKENNQIVELDAFCTDMAFKTYSNNQMDLLLFINVEASLIYEYIIKFDRFLSLLNGYQIPPENIVIEINEKGVKDFEYLIEFVELCRDKGFLIALDDVCSGHSNLNRIAATKPDIVKIDRMAIKDIDKDFYKQEITRAVINLSKKIGAVTVAEGIETGEEASTCLQMGVDLCQGYYFSKAIKPKQLEDLSFQEQFRRFTLGYKQQLTEKLEYERREIDSYKETITKLKERLQVVPIDVCQDVMKKTAEDSHIECIYVLNQDGYQLTDTIFKEDLMICSTCLFSPAVQNTCHDLKQYYYCSLLKQPEIFISDAYISLATGALCKTVSVAYEGFEKKTYILCMDYKCQEETDNETTGVYNNMQNPQL